MKKIVITKPIIEAGENLGFLPGDQYEKTLPYMKSYISTFEKILGKFLCDVLFESGVIEVNLLAYMRGDTFDYTCMILDEAQNVQMSQLMLWATRLGKDSYAVMMGDVSQYDIKKKDAKFLINVFEQLRSTYTLNLFLERSMNYNVYKYCNPSDLLEVEEYLFDNNKYKLVTSIEDKHCII